MADLGVEGQALFEALSSAVVKHKAATLPMILEASRSVDRLADLDDVINGKGVLNLLRFRLADDEGRVAEVKFDAVLSEARQQQNNFASLMKSILPNLDPAAGVAKERDLLDEIAQRRAARRTVPSKGSVRADSSG